MCILEHMASTFYLPFLLHLLLPLYLHSTVCYYLPYYSFMLPLYCVCIECARSFFSLCKSSRHLLSLIWLSLQHVGLTLMFLITYHILASIFASITSASYDVTLLTISFALAHLCCHRPASSLDASTYADTPTALPHRYPNDPDYQRRRRASRRQRRRGLLRSCVALVGDTSINAKLHDRLRRVSSGGCGLYLVHDSGATRKLLCATTSPLLSFLCNRRPAPDGVVTVGGGRQLRYVEEGEMVDDLRYDLYSALAAAKRGVKTVIDFDESGINRSYLL